MPTPTAFDSTSQLTWSHLHSQPQTCTSAPCLCWKTCCQPAGETSRKCETPWCLTPYLLLQINSRCLYRYLAIKEVMSLHKLSCSPCNVFGSTQAKVAQGPGWVCKWGKQEANRRQTGGYEYAVYTHYTVMTIVCKFMVMALTVMTFLYERMSACRCSSSFAAFSAFLTSYTKYSNHNDKQSSWTLLTSLPMLVSTWPLEHTHFAMPQRSFSEQGRGRGAPVTTTNFKTCGPCNPYLHHLHCM